MARLTEVDKTSVVGELYGLTALLEDVCADHGLNLISNPEKSLKLLRLFLKESIQLEQVKCEWATLNKGLNSLQTFEGYVEFDQHYKHCIVKEAASLYKGKVNNHRPSITAAMADQLLDELPPLRKKDSFTETQNQALVEGSRFEGLPELEFRQCQLACLLSTLECEDIKATLKEIVLLHALHIADRESERSNNSLDYGENHTPIDFIEKCAPLQEMIKSILKQANISDASNSINFQKQDFENLIQKFVSELGIWIGMCIQDCNDYHLANFRHIKHLLYLQEQKNAHLQNMRKQDLINFERNGQIFAANFNSELLMECSALYAKLNEMEQAFSTLKSDVKAETRAEYEDLVQGLSSQSFALRNRFQEYRGILYEDVLDGLTEARKEALVKLKSVSFRRSKEEKEKETFEVIEAEEDVRDLASENSALWTVVLKLKTMNEMKQLGLRSLYEKRISKLKTECNSVKKEHWELKIKSKVESELLKGQNTLIQSALTSSDSQLSTKRKEFEEQTRICQALSKWKANKSSLIENLESKLKKYAKLENMDVDEVLDSLEQKEQELKKLNEKEKRRSHTYHLQDVRNQKQLKKIANDMRNERIIKQDAFLEIDKLQAKLRTYENIASKHGIDLEALADDYNTKSRASTIRNSAALKSGFLTAQIGDLLRPTTAPDADDTISEMRDSNTPMPPVRDPLRRPRTQMDIRDGKKSTVHFPFPGSPPGKMNHL